MLGVGVASGAVLGASGVDACDGDGRAFEGWETALGVLADVAAAGFSDGWTRSSFFQVFQK